MCLRLYLDGDGQGKGMHVSLFRIIMKSDYDNLFSWPFKQKSHFTYSINTIFATLGHISPKLSVQQKQILQFRNLKDHLTQHQSFPALHLFCCMYFKVQYTLLFDPFILERYLFCQFECHNQVHMIYSMQKAGMSF